MTVTGPEGATSGALRYSPGFSCSIGPSMAGSEAGFVVDAAPGLASRMHAASGAQPHGFARRIRNSIGFGTSKVKSHAAPPDCRHHWFCRENSPTDGKHVSCTGSSSPPASPPHARQLRVRQNCMGPLRPGRPTVLPGKKQKFDPHRPQKGCLRERHFGASALHYRWRSQKL